MKKSLKKKLTSCWFALLMLITAVVLVGVEFKWAAVSSLYSRVTEDGYPLSSDSVPDTMGGKIASSALEQIGQTISYDPAYVKLSYPMGDVPIETGVCTDVVVRALRQAADFDLQQRMHEDMQVNFSSYPPIWGLTGPDSNIDHRRVPNIRHYLQRSGYSLPVSDDAADYQAGDIVTCKLPHGRDHIMVVSYQKSPLGVPLTIHNAGGGTGQNNCLFSYKLTGHYRLSALDR